MFNPLKIPARLNEIERRLNERNTNNTQTLEQLEQRVNDIQDGDADLDLYLGELTERLDATDKTLKDLSRELLNLKQLTPTPGA